MTCLQTLAKTRTTARKLFCFLFWITTLCSRKSSGFHQRSFALFYHPLQHSQESMECYQHSLLLARKLFLLSVNIPAYLSGDTSLSSLLLTYLTTIKHAAFLFMWNVTNTTNHQIAVSNPRLKRLQPAGFLTHKAYCCPEELAHSSSSMLWNPI